MEQAIKSNLRRTKILSTLTSREEGPRMRFGVGMNTDHTLEEVDYNFLLQERELDKLKLKLRKLKHPSRSKQ